MLGCKQFNVTAEIEKITWSTFTGVLGNEVVGIWEKYTNKTDVNATDAHFAEKCIVTGDGIHKFLFLDLVKIAFQIVFNLFKISDL